MDKVVPLRYRETDLLHPKARTSFLLLQNHLLTDFKAGLVSHEFRIFETYRHPHAQNVHFKRKTSHAEAYWSAHQYGLAADFVPFYQGRGFYWDVPANVWDHLRRRAHALGLKNDIAWDRAHVEHPLWPELRRVMFEFEDSQAYA